MTFVPVRKTNDPAEEEHPRHDAPVLCQNSPLRSTWEFSGSSCSSVILVDDAAGALSAADRGIERDHNSLVVVGWSVAMTVALVGPMGIEVVGILCQDGGGVLLVVDQHAVGALGVDSAYESLGVPVRGGGLGGLRLTWMSSEVNTASKLSVNWPPRSRIGCVNALARSPRSAGRLRAACVVQGPSGLEVIPRMCACRVLTSMTNRTWSRRRLMVSMWKKSVAGGPCAWVVGNVFQDGSARTRGGGRRWVAVRVRRIVPIPTWWPRPRSLP